MNIVDGFSGPNIWSYMIRNAGRYSLTRMMQYFIIENQNFTGKLLDYGGGERATYKKLIECDKYISVNIDHELNPTWKIDVNKPIPYDKMDFDWVISFNTLEHIYDCGLPISEMYRLLRPSGQIALTTPFLFPIHGHPDDYFRPTPSWYRETLTKFGFVDIEIIPLYLGPFSFTCEISPFKLLKHKYVIRLMLVLDMIYNKLRVHFGYSRDPKINNALGFFVLARKNES
jgi:SAM-dependent methyltransferase